MGRVSTAAEYGTQPTILFHPDGWSAFPRTFSQADPLSGEDGVIKAGTIFPANDATAQGIILLDVNTAARPAEGAVLFIGSVRLDRLPEQPTQAAIQALPRVSFFGTDGAQPYPATQPEQPETEE